MNRVEILAPAGSYESMTAAINAGADAVYMGGSRFGARAFADNPDEALWLQAIDYAHLHGCRLYMTVNTLTKEAELDELYEYLLPYYKQGLDAVIVQDMGVLSFIREYFPALPIHASTQMTITGYHGAKLLKELGAARIVTARELSLSEIARIRDEVDIEIESFVHGALCYGYSGQCLLSSFIGGRSGNRGRCAQPCRLPYDVLKADGSSTVISRKDEQYVLSLKDLCTLDIIPDIIEAGVHSMKIEGRMKSPRYTAGVVSIYRKYTDYYLAHGRDGYAAAEQDKALLLDLFDRGGLTEGYYRQHNGRSMVALKEKPAFRAADQQLFNYLDENYVNKKKQEPVYGIMELSEGKPCRLDLRMVHPMRAPISSSGQGNDAGVSTRPARREGMETAVSVTGAVVQTAKNQALSAERIAAQINKTGNTPFIFADLEIRLQGACFLPMQELNELRRRGLSALEQKLVYQYRRIDAGNQEQPGREGQNGTVRHSAEGISGSNLLKKKQPEHVRLLHVTLENPEHLKLIAAEPQVDEVSLDAVGFAPETWKAAVHACHQAGKSCRLIMPHIFRKEAEKYFIRNMEILKAAGFDGLLIRSLEEAGFLNEQGIGLPLVFDYTLYGMNHRACDYFSSAGAARQTLPAELNSRELEQLGCTDKELIVYGYLPAMVSAQCIVKTIKSCRKRPELLYLKDRLGKRLPVRNHCRFCYNTIYNTSPLSLLGMEAMTARLRPSVIRMQFTIESEAEVKALLHAYVGSFYHGQTVKNPMTDFTRGHFKRGIE